MHVSYTFSLLSTIPASLTVIEQGEIIVSVPHIHTGDV